MELKFSQRRISASDPILFEVDAGPIEQAGPVAARMLYAPAKLIAAPVHAQVVAPQPQLPAVRAPLPPSAAHQRTARAAALAASVLLFMLLLLGRCLRTAIGAD